MQGKKRFKKLYELDEKKIVEMLIIKWRWGWMVKEGVEILVDR